MVRIFVVVLIVMLSGVFGVMALENKGASEIMLKGGSRGVVRFPHHLHQNTLKDCQICHALFPQEQGGIERLKKTGELVKKQVMNKHCINCHKATQKAGNRSGPTKCSKCHLKEHKNG